jgi:hypothetical protein
MILAFTVNFSSLSFPINVRENRRGNQEWIIPSCWQQVALQDTGQRQTKQKQSKKQKYNTA